MSDENENDVVDFGDLDTDFNEAKAPEGGAPVPNGNYQAVISKAYAGKSQQSDNRLFKWCLKIQGPKCKGRTVWKNATMEADRIQWFKKDVIAMGVAPAVKSLNDFANEDWVNENLIGLVMDITVRHKGEFTNVYFNKCVGKVEIEDEDGGADEAIDGSDFDDGEIPF